MNIQGKQLHSTRYVLAIDLGSGSCKVALVSDVGVVVASAEKGIGLFSLPDGGSEQDANEWWDITRKATREVVAASGISPKDIVAVACDSQWSVVVPVDVHGNPLMRAIHWTDKRGGRYNRSIIGGFPRIQGYGLFKLLKWIHLTGLVPTKSGVDSLGHVLFIKNERPGIFARTYKFLEPMDYITARLTGKITATQKTMAPFIVMDNKQWGSQKYNEALLKLAGLKKDKFPELLPNDSIVGRLQPSVAQELGLLPSTVVVSGIEDSNATLIGSGAVLDFETIISIGTSQYMTCHLPFKKTSLSTFMTSMPSPFKSRYYLLGEQGAGGKCVEFFLKNIIYPADGFLSVPKPLDVYKRFNEMAAEAPPGSERVIFLPWLNGSLVPSENPNMRGGFINLSLNTTRSHLARSLMEGLAYNNRWTLEALKKFIGRPIKKIRFSGGGALSDVWSQIHADVLDVPIYQVEDPVNATVRGAAFLAFMTLKYRTMAEISTLVKIKHVFNPNESNRMVYDKMYARFRELFKRNQKIFNALNE